MTSDNIDRDCSSVSGLIQPYVDGELSDSERKTVLGHLDGCSSCRTGVQQQQQVRSALRELEQDMAPAALRTRVLAELDRIDVEESESENVSWLSAAFGRVGAFMRGGMLLAPAAAAAVALFFVVRGNVDSETLAGNSTNLVHHEAEKGEAIADATPPPEAAAEPAKAATKLQPVEGAFEMQFTSEGSLPPGIQLVGAGNAEQARGTVRLRQNDGSGVVDLQRPSAQVRPEGKEQVFRGRPYYLRRDAQGRPVVQFELGGVLHDLTWEDAPGRVGAPVQLEEADLRGLVELAHSLQSSHAP